MMSGYRAGDWRDFTSMPALVRFERYPEDPEALRGKAEALLALGRRRDAIAALERAYVRAPTDRGIAWRLLEERRKGSP